MLAVAFRLRRTVIDPAVDFPKTGFVQIAELLATFRLPIRERDLGPVDDVGRQFLFDPADDGYKYGFRRTGQTTEQTVDAVNDYPAISVKLEDRRGNEKPSAITGLRPDPFKQGNRLLLIGGDQIHDTFQPMDARQEA